MIWKEATQEAKVLHINYLVLKLDQNLRKENPEQALALLVPVDTSDEVRLLWESVVSKTVTDSQVKDISTEYHRLYFPVIKEVDGTASPYLHTSKDEEYGLLYNHFSGILQGSGVDLKSLLPINLSIDCLRGFYLASTLLK
jgi:hypothetical protein